MSEQPEGPNLAAYAAGHGLSHRLFSAALPKATQLMRHGFLQEVPSVARGELPGCPPDSWLAFASYAYEGRSDVERSRFTLVLIQAPKSLGFAVRVLCHDRDLSERDRANPDADREVIELDDRAVKLESEGFLERYALSTDHDQDQIAVWQLFGPKLIDWLTDQAPGDFSFELQDGALCCFVPGFVDDPEQLDGLCHAAGRVFRGMAEIERERTERSGPGGVPSRDAALEQELAAHPFRSPPKSTKAAAKEFRRGPLLGDRSWKLGSEAFFRAHALARGFQPIALSAFRAGHIQTALPGLLAHVAQGPLPSIGIDGYPDPQRQRRLRRHGLELAGHRRGVADAIDGPRRRHAARRHRAARIDPGGQRRPLAVPDGTRWRLARSLRAGAGRVLQCRCDDPGPARTQLSRGPAQTGLSPRLRRPCIGRGRNRRAA